MPKASGIGPKVRELLLAGKSNNEIRRATGCSKATVSHHAKALGTSASSRPSYVWRAIATAVDEGASFRECQEHFGCGSSAFYRAIRKGKIERPTPRLPRHYLTSQQLSDVLMGQSGWGPRSKMKAKMLKEGLFERVCSSCGLDTWLGQPLPLRLDHIDGDGTNFALKNLRLLCGNCDSLQETYCHRNIGRKAGVAKSVDAVALKSAA